METTAQLPELEVSLSVGGMVSLAQCFGVKGSSMVPLANGEGRAAPTPEDLAGLRKAGLMDAQDRLDAKLGTALQAIVSAAAYGRVKFGLGKPHLDVVVFHTASGPASLVTTGDRVRLNTRPDLEDLGRAIAQITGISMLRTIALDANLSAGAAACFAAALDGARHAWLRALLDGRDPEPTEITAQSMQGWLTQSPAHGQWLTARFLMGREGGVTTSAIEGGLGELSGKGLLTSAGAQYRCGDGLMDAAMRLAVLDDAATLMAARGHSGNISGATTIDVVRGGANGILIWEHGPDGSVHFMGLSPAGLLAIAVDFLGNPEALPQQKLQRQQPATPAAAADGPRFCAQCGNAVQPGDRFCRGCGQLIG